VEKPRCVIRKETKGVTEICRAIPTKNPDEKFKKRNEKHGAMDRRVTFRDEARGLADGGAK
jgi:hypothetical protein